MTEAVKLFWRPSFRTFYNAYYQELAAISLLTRLNTISVTTAVVVGVTATGSTIAGLKFWNNPHVAPWWLAIASVASLLSIVNASLRTNERLKEQDEIRRKFTALRIDVETFRQDLQVGLTKDAAAPRYQELRKRYSTEMAQVPSRLAFTGRLRKRLMKELTAIMKNEGYVEE